MKTFTRPELARLIEYALTNPQATQKDIAAFCEEARSLGFRAVSVLGSRVEMAYALLEETEVKINALVGFPFGAADSDVKRYEVEVAVDHGAHEIEMMLNIGRLKDGDRACVLRELRDVAEAADERTVKLIIETALLTVEERRSVCELALDSGIHFICTGSGIGKSATLEEVIELRTLLGEKFGLKATGRFNLTTALALLEAGATRIGTNETCSMLTDLPK